MGCSRRIQKSIKKLRIELCKITTGRPNCKVIDAVIGVRGTEFVVEREDGNITKIAVIG